ncbi:MAG: DUF3106 domain-containing protein, partial [Deltaproteobacteria bacterium]|nr:DUF3106 domain-containing protein [Deltaproteobacteria bacterium]
MFSKRLFFFCGCLLLVASVVSTPAYAKKNGKHGGQSGGNGYSGGSGYSGGQGPAGNGNLQQWWQELPDNERQMLRDRYEIFQGLPEEQQDRLRQRWQNYRELPPEQRQE